jgi:hypothetical protein
VPTIPDGPLTLDEVEKRQIQDALRRAKGKKIEAARILGIDRKRLARKSENTNWINCSEGDAGEKNKSEKTSKTRRALRKA